MLEKKDCLLRTRFGVALEAEHNLRRTIPSRCHVFRHVARIFLWVDGESSRQAKIAYLQLAVGVHKEVTRFEVAV